MGQKYLSDEEKKLVESLGGWDKLMETLKQRLEEQKKRHQGGNKWIGTGGTSPFGAYGYNPEGIRIRQNESRNKKAVKAIIKNKDLINSICQISLVSKDRIIRPPQLKKKPPSKQSI